MRFPSSPCFGPYVRHSVSRLSVDAPGNFEGKPKHCLPMQHSLSEIKDKLLRALDNENNVVDMATVLEVISTLEKAIITRETLEKTRIGKYINELRKKTSNEQLARRAKELVKSWRKLLPHTQAENTINGERVISNIGNILGPSSGNKFSKNNSPSVCERSARESPFCSSASNSPQLLVAKQQITSRPTTPSSNVSIKLNQSTERGRNDKTNLYIQGKGLASSQVFKPVSPALASVRSVNTGPPVTDSILPHPKPQNASISPAYLNNYSTCFDYNATNMCVTAETCNQVNYENSISVSLVSSGSSHDTLDIAKTNVANKRLRKNQILVNERKKRKAADDVSLLNDGVLHNGVSLLSDELLPSESSAFERLNRNPCGMNDCSNEREVNSLSKFSSACVGLNKDLLKRERFSSIGAKTKLPKVKTTQQLIQELQARKDALNISETHTVIYKTHNVEQIDNLQQPSDMPIVELIRSNSEKSTELTILGCATGREKTIDRKVLPAGDSDNVSNENSVICVASDRHPSVLCRTGLKIDIEIEQILSQLPPINREEIKLKMIEEPLPLSLRKTSVTAGDLEKLSSEQWVGVNGNYDCNGKWRTFIDCVDVEITPDEKFRILPYVNID